MKGIGILLSVIAITTTLYAENSEKKWIPLQPMQVHDNAIHDSNKSKHSTDTKIVQNIKVIKNLLDHINSTGLNTENDKKWYSFEPADSE